PANAAPSSTTPATAEPSVPSVEPPPVASPCPRCNGPLTNPEGLGWCPKCGYCRSLEEDANKAALAAPPAARRPSALGFVEFFEVLGKLPSWLWPLLGGIVGVVVLSFAADFVLPNESLSRALWSAIQLILGL